MEAVEALTSNYGVQEMGNRLRRSFRGTKKRSSAVLKTIVKKEKKNGWTQSTESQGKSIDNTQHRKMRYVSRVKLLSFKGILRF